MAGRGPADRMDGSRVKGGRATGCGEDGSFGMYAVIVGQCWEECARVRECAGRYALSRGLGIGPSG